MTLDRRHLITAGLAYVALTSGKALAQSRRPVLVTIFNRGGMDGLNVVPPHGDADYYALRPTIAIPKPGSGANAAIDLDGFFGFHPSLAPLKPLYDAGELAVVHATGFPRPDRSHFTAEVMYERAAPPGADGQGGWMGRLLEATGGIAAGALRGISIGRALDESLQGSRATAAIANAAEFRLLTRFGDPWRDALGDIYAGASETAFIGRNVLAVVDAVAQARPHEIAVENGALYPADAFGDAMTQAAQYIKSGIGVQAIGINTSGWDLHASENTVLPDLLASLAQGLAAFRTDLGERFADVVVVTMSEFGRTVQENASLGTDHGYANAMFALGGRINGGQVLRRWPGLVNPANAAGDLEVTTDYREALGEVVAGHFGANPTAVFPGYRHRGLGLLR